MTLQNTLIRLADAFRNKFYISDKLSLEDMIALLSSKSVTIVPSSNFSIPNALPVVGTKLIQLGTSINGGQSSWGRINGLSITSAKAIELANDPNYVLSLHLYITDTNNGVMWLKWDETNNRTEFTPVVGDNLIQLPSADKVSRFDLMLHPFFDSVTIDPTKSYIEAVPSN